MKTSQALLAGARRATERLWPVGALTALGAGEMLLALVLVRAGLLALDASTGVALLAAAGAAGVGTLLFRLGRAVVLYRALGPGGDGWPAVVVRALGYFALSAALRAMVALWLWTGLIAGGRAYLLEVGNGWAAGSSAALAATLAFGAFLTGLTIALCELGLARSAGQGEPYSASLAWAAGALVQRPVTYAWILSLTASVTLGVLLGLGGLSQAAGPEALLLAPLPTLGAAVAAGLASSLVEAVMDLTRLYALQAAQEAPEGPGPALRPSLTATLVDAPGSGD